MLCSDLYKFSKLKFKFTNFFHKSICNFYNVLKFSYLLVIWTIFKQKLFALCLKQWYIIFKKCKQISCITWSNFNKLNLNILFTYLQLLDRLIHRWSLDLLWFSILISGHSNLKKKLFCFVTNLLEQMLIYTLT